MNSVLMTGEIPGLFAKDEMMAMTADLRNSFLKVMDVLLIYVHMVHIHVLLMVFFCSPPPCMFLPTLPLYVLRQELMLCSITGDSVALTWPRISSAQQKYAPNTHTVQEQYIAIYVPPFQLKGLNRHGHQQNYAHQKIRSMFVWADWCPALPWYAALMYAC